MKKTVGCWNLIVPKIRIVFEILERLLRIVWLCLRFL